MRTVKSLLLALTLGFFSYGCNVGDDTDGITYGYLPTSEVSVVGAVGKAGSETKMSVRYILSNTCQEFVGFDIMKNEDNTKEIAILVLMRSEKSCVTSEIEQSREFTFTPSQPGEYTFKFMKGQLDFSDAVSLVINVPE